ncbi:aldehyde dehydrogenase family protein [candidate division KSB1 bacterium]
MSKIYKYFIGGKRTGSSGTVSVRNPYSGKEICKVYKTSPADIEKTAEFAKKGFEATKKLPSHKRSEILKNIAEGIKNNSEDLSKTLALEAGKPIKFAAGEVDRAVLTFTIASEETKRICGEFIDLDLNAVSENRYGIVKRFPMGPILAISPFNFPLNLVAHKIAPAIAAGNSFVLKPASATPVTALKLGEIILESGYPEQAVNIIVCPGSQAEILVGNDAFKLISFTGSAEVGWKLKSTAGKKVVVLELGGNAGVIVEDDADIDFAVKRCVLGGFVYAGQVCISVQRIFVNKNIFKEFKDKFIKEVSAVKVGDPLNENVILSSMIDEYSAKNTEKWVNEAVSEGAEILTGGKRKGSIYYPTVLTNTKAEMKVRKEEVFAPLVTLESYDTFEDAVSLVDEGVYGLQAGIFTNDIKKIWYAYENIEVGGLIINDFPTYRIDHMPYGGVKDSGLGREGLKYAIQEMTEPKLLALNLG